MDKVVITSGGGDQRERSWKGGPDLEERNDGMAALHR